MEFITAFWPLWLVVMIIGYGYALFNQLQRMQGVMRSPVSTLDMNAEDSFFSGIGKMFVAGFIGMSGMVLLVIAIIVNIINAT